MFQTKSTVKSSYVFSVPQRQSLTSAQWVTGSFPEAEGRYSDWSFSPRSSGFRGNGLSFPEVCVLNLGTGVGFEIMMISVEREITGQS